ncbi:MAG: 16S rRNA (cytosine(967)-C(5))-methyltransferase [Burkholderia sp.]|jgi:16S rRNA (cytosine967-C5)-methyltransferase
MTAESVKSAPLSQIFAALESARTELRGGASLNTVVRPALEKLPAAARPAAQAVLYECSRRTALLAAVVPQLCAKRPHADVLSLIEEAIAALLMGRRSDYAVVSEAVNAARLRSSTERAAGFVNAVLRRFLREKDALLAQAMKSETVRFNAPAWWIAQMKAAWPAEAERFMALAAKHPPLTLRVNTARVGIEDYRRALEAAGIACRRTGEEALTLEKPLPVEKIPGFGMGLCSVQDAGTQLAAHFLPLKKGDRVLDACAAPGGKTAHLLERNPGISMTALEIDASRTEKIRATLRRLGLRAEVRTADASKPEGWWDGRPFDAILLDAPCTASGVTRRQPDTPWVRRADDIRHLAAAQKALLQNLWPLLAKRGKMLYVTCSVFPEEGSGQIASFLKETPDAALSALAPGLGGSLTLLPEDKPEYRPGTLIPSVHDGFFYALLEKIGD